MSEYQYYEFQAIDRPLGEADREALRSLSSRASITATSFTNSYEWGDFRGDPARLMETWFDLHLYLSNWGARRLMVRFPTRLVDRHRLDAFVAEVESVDLRVFGESLILTIERDELDLDAWHDGSGRLAALAPLRADVMAGDLRLFHLIWLMAVEDDVLEVDAPEPMSGLGPMTGALQAFAAFFGMDADLVEAAAERPGVASPEGASAGAARAIISALPDPDKTDMLSRLFDGDPHVAVELRAKVRTGLMAGQTEPPASPRTVGELRTRAAEIGRAREEAAARKREAERRRLAEEQEKARQARLLALARRGEGVWREVEAEIGRGSASAYDKAANVLADLQAVAEARGTLPDFRTRMRAIRERHARKGRFIERLERMR